MTLLKRVLKQNINTYYRGLTAVSSS